ncbi:sigma-70 family RNA polymerase sigma factor [Stieleria varia]|uniref:RNA polymerase sigma factor YlaC n=1 Tax=Stieleria varia TaxID=2528005 RepID=A0A5C5ZKF0_9BACT|nr:sigma-70 family RNA polymerase sigma factor [Stieleria varia]TWT87862.1 RNA polymerase sigma factor YlaC [Stieleria varia]
MDVSRSDSSLSDQLNRYRSYLSLLAEAELGKRLRERVSPSDVVQETLLEAYRDRGNYRGTHEYEFVAWLRKILHHTLLRLHEAHVRAACRDIRREVKFSQLDRFEESAIRFEQSLVDQSNRPEDNVDRYAQIAAVSSALTQLRPDYRHVLMLRNFQELSFDQIATEMGRSCPAVRMLWLRALQALRKQLSASDQ